MKITSANDAFAALEGVWQNKIAGQWQDDFGFHVISQPMAGAAGDFEILFDPMRETLTLALVGGPLARNVGVGGASEYLMPMKYEVAIETPEGVGIHHELGYFLLAVGEDGCADDDAKANVVREASVPRANAMLTTGFLSKSAIAEVTDIYSARPSSTDSALQTRIDEKFAAMQVNLAAKGGPDFDAPLQWLATKLPGDAKSDWGLSFRDDKPQCNMAHGQCVPEPVGIGNLLSDFWIGERSLDGNETLVLQYAERVDILFSGAEWPHVAVNTLVKQG